MIKKEQMSAPNKRYGKSNLWSMTQFYSEYHNCKFHQLLVGRNI